MILRYSILLLVKDGGESLADLSFLMGSLPTAPPVLVFAQQYGLDVPIISSSLVLSLILSLPLITATTTILTSGGDLSSVYFFLRLVSFDLSIASAASMFVIFLIAAAVLRRSRPLWHLFVPFSLLQFCYHAFYAVCLDDDLFDPDRGVFGPKSPTTLTLFGLLDLFREASRLSICLIAATLFAMTRDRHGKTVVTRTFLILTYIVPVVYCITFVLLGATEPPPQTSNYRL